MLYFLLQLIEFLVLFIIHCKIFNMKVNIKKKEWVLVCFTSSYRFFDFHILMIEILQIIRRSSIKLGNPILLKNKLYLNLLLLKLGLKIVKMLLILYWYLFGLEKSKFVSLNFLVIKIICLSFILIDGGRKLFFYIFFNKIKILVFEY